MSKSGFFPIIRESSVGVAAILAINQPKIWDFFFSFTFVMVLTLVEGHTFEVVVNELRCNQKQLKSSSKAL